MLQLNEAIRKGVVSLPRQAFGSLVSENGKEGCVLGALYLGSGCLTHEELTIGLSSGSRQIAIGTRITDYLKTVDLMEEEVTCPVRTCSRTTGGPIKVSNMLVHLNDTHYWSREAIAEWADPRPELHVAMPTPEEAQVTA